MANFENVDGTWLTLGLTALGAAASAYAGQRTYFAPDMGMDFFGSAASHDWITRPGKLGGPGYMKKPAWERHELLDACVEAWGYRSCLGSVEVLKRNRRVYAKYKVLLDADTEYLVRTYGGAGSFGPQRQGRAQHRRAA